MNKKDEYIVIISEGEKTEKRIISNLQREFEGLNNKIIFLSYKTNIYELFKEIVEDEYIDIIGLLKERQIKANEVREDVRSIDVSNINRDDTSQIYLFFDYDGHDPEYSNEKIIQMIKIFNNETENGKLYISYPMVEALKHLKKNKVEMENYIVNIKKNTKYKELVNKNSDFTDLRKFRYEDWEFIINENLNRCIFLFEIEEKINYYIYTNRITQESIFNRQLDKYISKEEKILVLSAFPFFLIEYFGDEFFKKILNQL